MDNVPVNSISKISETDSAQNDVVSIGSHLTVWFPRTVGGWVISGICNLTSNNISQTNYQDK